MISDTLVATMYFGVQCLNPCFNGRWSQTRDGALRARVPVLILALMEDGLGQEEIEDIEFCKPVLILVLMEDGLGLMDGILMLLDAVS